MDTRGYFCRDLAAVCAGPGSELMGEKQTKLLSGGRELDLTAAVIIWEITIFMQNNFTTH